MPVHIVTVPYRYDEYMDGMGRGPIALLRAGLRSRLNAVGVETTDPKESKLPDDERVDGPIAANIGALGRHTAELVRDALSNDDTVLVIAGDDTATIGVVSGVQLAKPDAKIGVVWIDAHPDFNTPETSFSGILAGMPVAILAGLAGPIWRESANLRHTLPTDHIVIAGVRMLDEKEGGLLHSTDVRVIEAKSPQRSQLFEQAIERLASRVDAIVVNVDLDVLDPQYVPSASTPEANGLSPRQVAWMISQVTKHGKTAAVSVTSLNPGAGARGEKSVASTLSVLEQALPGWQFSQGEQSDGSAS
ncbi:MAG: arginase family protein [Thermomicrobiales bacterium]|nr:arginase family protein [Thermomicrobiales bacterium]